MKFGFDLDGTLDRPEIAEMARALFRAGHEIHVITVGRLGPRAWGTIELKKLRLESLGVPYTKVHIVEGDTYTEAGQAKAAVINREDIVTMIDDSTTMSKEMARGTGASIMFLRDYGDADA